MGSYQKAAKNEAELHVMGPQRCHVRKPGHLFEREIYGIGGFHEETLKCMAFSALISR